MFISQLNSKVIRQLYFCGSNCSDLVWLSVKNRLCLKSIKVESHLVFSTENDAYFHINDGNKNIHSKLGIMEHETYINILRNIVIYFLY